MGGFGYPLGPGQGLARRGGGGAPAARIMIIISNVCVHKGLASFQVSPWIAGARRRLMVGRDGVIWTHGTPLHHQCGRIMGPRPTALAAAARSGGRRLRSWVSSLGL